ncbi:hypothetical protein MNBD_GAMMA03-2085 [hydrothermal vent metagenome]|uniref:Uncharacterized protein n=1 Tax=hydrothermal vent metagenome TaxID=652676 RepID=A0A3B0WG15_9ZZZZ
MFKFFSKIYFSTFFCLLISFSAQAQINVNFSTEQSERHRLRKLSSQSTVGYEYNSFEKEKELIFKQLKVITGDEETRYIIVPGDTMTISYMDRGKEQGYVYKVSSEGKIHLPLLGAVQVRGLNRRQARAILSEMFKEYIRHPKLKVTVNTSGRIIIVGAVRQPGLYLLQPNLTVMEAILKAGSYKKDDANLKSVLVMRGGTDNPIVKRLDLKKMLKKGDRSDDILVKPGDLIYVPDKFIVNLEKFKDTVYRYVSAYYGYGRLPESPTREENTPLLWGK